MAGGHCKGAVLGDDGANPALADLVFTGEVAGGLGLGGFVDHLVADGFDECGVGDVDDVAIVELDDFAEVVDADQLG